MLKNIQARGVLIGLFDSWARWVGRSSDPPVTHQREGPRDPPLRPTAIPCEIKNSKLVREVPKF